MWNGGNETPSTRAAALVAGHGGGEAALIEKDEARRVQPGLGSTPGEAGGGNVGTFLLRRVT
jgi:hypothetical protein